MRKYVKPQAEKLEFNYAETIAASNITVHHGDVGHGYGMGGCCDHIRGRGNPKKLYP